MEFKAFPSIERIGKIVMTITQKIHGSNAQVYIYPVPEHYYWDEESQSHIVNDGAVEVNGTFLKLLCGSRTRWITPEKDNYGFAAFVYANKQEFIEKLGPGQHFGEWSGPGINSGEGLTEKTFVLFDFWKHPPEKSLPPQCKVVPCLYRGKFDFEAIETVMQDLKTNGSKLVSGFMRPEGVVVELAGHRYKKVFDAEETKWTGKDPNYVKRERTEVEDYSHLLQPIRLEKLLSRDEEYEVGFPKNLPKIVDDYIADLVKEEQIVGDEQQIELIKTKCRSQVFKFIRFSMEQI